MSSCQLREAFMGEKVFPWSHILRLLPPRNAAVVACVCRTWRDTVLQLRSRDVACGTEAVFILAEDAASARALGSSFTYTREQTLWEDIDETAGSEACNDANNLHAVGCTCTFDSCAGGCPCPCSLSGFECGPACGCKISCNNRTSQQRTSCLLSVKRTRCGYGVFLEAPVAAGAFVCTYAGEVLPFVEAARRQELPTEHRYVMAVREHAGSTLVTHFIDPSVFGNVGRFVNHSCDGGCLESRVVRASGVLAPRVAFFARRALAASEELTFQFGSPTASGSKACLCNTAACLGRMPCD